MLSKRINRAATVAWCPSAKCSSLIASGTVEGIIDDDFQSNSRLEIYDTNLAIQGMEMPMLGSTEAHCCFKKIAWGTKGIENNQFPAGLVAGGMIDGTVCLWNADAVMRNQENALVARTKPMQGPVLSLEFHPMQENLLASGSQDSQIFLWNLRNPSAPVGELPGDVGKSQLDVPALAWNKKVLHILATANSRGEISIWDLRQKKVVITFRDSSHSNSPATSVMWNPTQARQLVVTYYSGHGEIWDLRHAMSPKYVLAGDDAHSKSILSASWNCLDPDVFLTSGEDSKCVVWDSRGTILNSFTTDDDPNFDVAWSPHSGPLFAGSSFNGKISIRAVQNTGDNHVPTWLNRPAGVSFGFGGKLVDFSAEKPSQPSDPKTPRSSQGAWVSRSLVNFRQLVPDQNLIQKTREFSAVTQNVTQNLDCKAYCDQKHDSARGDKERSTWAFIRILFEEDSRSEFIRQLGYEPPQPVEEEQPGEDLPQLEPKQTTKKEQRRESFDSEESVDFFDKISTPDAGTPAESDDEPEKHDLPPLERKQDLMFLQETETDRNIRNCLVVGDFEKAVDLCFTAGKLADALMIANCRNDLWEKTRIRFFNQHKLKFMKDVMSSVVVGEIEPLVENSDLNDWRQTLAIIMSYTQDQRSDMLCNQLGDRLMQINDHDAALACFICACNVEQMITALMARDKHENHADPLVALHNAIEKAFVFSYATGSAGAPPDGLARKYSEYAELMASQGQLSEALTFLDITSQGQPGPHFQVMMDRLFHSNPVAAQIVQQPRCPFDIVNVPSTLGSYGGEGNTFAHAEGAGHRRQRNMPPSRRMPHPRTSMPDRDGASTPNPRPNPRNPRPGVPLHRRSETPEPASYHDRQPGGSTYNPPMHPGSNVPSVPTRGMPRPIRRSVPGANTDRGQPRPTKRPVGGYFGQNPVAKGFRDGQNPVAKGFRDGQNQPPQSNPLPREPAGSGMPTPAGGGGRPSGPGGYPAPGSHRRDQPLPGLPGTRPSNIPPPGRGGGGPGGPRRVPPRDNRPSPRHETQPRTNNPISPPTGGLRDGPTIAGPPTGSNAPQPRPPMPQPHTTSHPTQPRPYTSRPMPPATRGGAPDDRSSMPQPAHHGRVGDAPGPSGSANPQPTPLPRENAPLPRHNAPLPRHNAPLPRRNPPMPSPNPPMPSSNPSMPSPNPSMPQPNAPMPSRGPGGPPGGARGGAGAGDAGGDGVKTMPSRGGDGRNPMPSRRTLPSTSRPQGWHSRPARTTRTLPSRGSGSVEPPDISGLAPAHQALVQALINGVERLNGANLKVMEQRKVEGITKRSLRSLVDKFARNEVSRETEDKLSSLISAFSSGDYAVALQYHVEIVTAGWSENKAWLTGVKNLLTLSQKHQL